MDHLLIIYRQNGKCKCHFFLIIGFSTVLMLRIKKVAKLAIAVKLFFGYPNE